MKEHCYLVLSAQKDNRLCIREGGWTSDGGLWLTMMRRLKRRTAEYESGNHAQVASRHDAVPWVAITRVLVDEEPHLVGIAQLAELAVPTICNVVGLGDEELCRIDQIVGEDVHLECGGGLWVFIYRDGVSAPETRVGERGERRVGEAEGAGVGFREADEHG